MGETLQQYGVAKHMNLTLLEKVRCILSNIGLDKAFWVEATNDNHVGIDPILLFSMLNKSIYVIMLLHIIMLFTRSSLT